MVCRQVIPDQQRARSVARARQGENTASRKYYLSRFHVTNLWGQSEFDLRFNSDVNIIIGPNASGKTTILNLLRYVLTADVMALSEFDFDELTVVLRSFRGRSTRTVKVSPMDEGFRFSVGHHSYPIQMETPSGPRQQWSPEREAWIRRRLKDQVREVQMTVTELVPAVWLPVSRRLPIGDVEDDVRYSRVSRRKKLESVDECLRELLKELVTYRSRLDTHLSEEYEDFKRRVLGITLFDKRHDKLGAFRAEAPLTTSDKDQLVRAYEVAGLLDTQMQKRIDEHFKRAADATARVRQDIADKKGLDIDDVLVMPIIRRTRSMVEFARQLESERQALFEPLQHYIAIVNSFLTDKTATVTDTGELRIEASYAPGTALSLDVLSSGEKQIIILLTQALLFEEEPVVYVADEPELSLHITWQEKLLQSLVSLGGEIQIIVATHSPDIVGPFRDKVIDLGKRSS